MNKLIKEYEEKKSEYKNYIINHKFNVQIIWNRLQRYLKGEYWLDDNTWLHIDKLIDTHDDSKLEEYEFNGMRPYFYPTKEEKENRDYYKKCMDYSWNKHQKTNQHHWQYWVLIEDGKQVALDMNFIYIIEMLCDWTAMSLTVKDLPSEFYNNRKEDMLLHENTKEAIDNWLPLFDKTVREYNEVQKK